jgi:hypothetical protein
MAVLDFADPLGQRKMRIQVRAVRHDGEVEEAAAPL